MNGWVVLPGTHNRFRGEELLLMTLEMCAKGVRLIDLSMKYNLDHFIIGKGINYLASFMQNNWAYLIRDNFEFWHIYLRQCCNAIRNKLIDHYDLNVNKVGDIDDGFLICAFIDCNLIPITRTGGGPETPGQFAAR